MNIRLSAAALVAMSVVMPVTGMAQKTTASGKVITQVPQQGPTTVCNPQDGGPGVLSALATCVNQTVKGGKAATAAEASIAEQSASAAVVLKQTGSNPLVAYAEAEARVTNRIAVSGQVNSGDYIVLHFLAEYDQHFAGLNSDVFNAEVLAARGEGDDNPSFFIRAIDGQGNGTHQSNSGRVTDAGFDLLLSLDNFTGLYKYTYGVGITMAINSNLPRTSGVSLGVNLLGIDAYDTQDRFLGSVNFHEDGSESLELASLDEPPVDETPEPASVALLATGLIGIRQLRRRRSS